MVGAGTDLLRFLVVVAAMVIAMVLVVFVVLVCFVRAVLVATVLVLGIVVLFVFHVFLSFFWQTPKEFVRLREIGYCRTPSKGKCKST